MDSESATRDISEDNGAGKMHVENDEARSCVLLISQVDHDEASDRKRKRDYCIGKSVDWIRKVAADPCNPILGTLPENEHSWKLLLVRHAMMMTKNDKHRRIEQSIWQKKQMMHPTMYGDYSATLRCSQRILSAKTSQPVLSIKKLSQAQSCSESTSLDTQSDLEDSMAGLWFEKYSRREIPLGDHQAEVPEWTDKATDTDLKWLGTRIWPQETGVNRNCLIERDPIEFGRRDLCGCEFKGSFECVRSHVCEERSRLKLELGVAFYAWHIDKMGEEVASSWDKADELKFEAIIKSNPPCKKKRFWGEIHKKFGYKKREQLVSYYFNVFLLRRRGLQNRSTPIEISSDDDGLDFKTTINCSGQTAVRCPKPRSYCWRKKTRLNFKK